MVRAPTPVRMYAPTFEVDDEVSVETQGGGEKLHITDAHLLCSSKAR